MQEFLVEVVVPLPVPGTFTYVAAEPIRPGVRVLVPFGPRRLVGWVVGEGRADSGREDVRAIVRKLEEEPSITPALLELARWIGEYYLCPLGQVLRAALPAALSSPGRRDPRPRTRRALRLTRWLPSLKLREEVFGRAARQRECYEVLESMGGVGEAADLAGRHGFSSSVLTGLVERGVAEWTELEAPRDPFATRDAEAPAVQIPTAGQQAALAELLDAAVPSAPDPRAFLLRGVTGSGKTLVYIELLEEIVGRQGRGAIVLVPEIALTPQTVARFRGRFGDDVAVLHSALSDGERYDAWRALKRGDRRIAVGARSAIFAPVRELGAIVVDEEHEATYKQSETPRYHAREVAVIRARLEGAVCVLGSATPALESWHNVARGKYRLLELPARIGGRPLPEVRIVDLRAAPAGAGGEAVGGKRGRASFPILSGALLEALRDRLDRREQSILLLNRRGYSSFVQCRGCGDVWQCPRCNVTLTFHRGRRRLLCHYCLHEAPPPEVCDRCGSEALVFRGVGTEQVERSVVEAFPGARVARMDVDTTSGKWAHHRILDRVGRGEIDILLGTQMIAKGLDFPGVTLVGVVNADVGMNLPDFRASERTFQLMTQVAGRAGRGPLGGQVLVQTALPEHYAIRFAMRHDFVRFAEREIEERSGPGYPPHNRLANILVSGTEEEAVQEAAAAAAAWTAERILAAGREDVLLTGPAPSPIDRIRGRWRWHFLLRSPSSRSLGWACRQLAEDYPLRGSRGGVRIILDRDPVALL